MDAVFGRSGDEGGSAVVDHEPALEREVPAHMRLRGFPRTVRCRDDRFGPCLHAGRAPALARPLLPGAGFAAARERRARQEGGCPVFRVGLVRVRVVEVNERFLALFVDHRRRKARAVDARDDLPNLLPREAAVSGGREPGRGGEGEGLRSLGVELRVVEAEELLAVRAG